MFGKEIADKYKSTPYIIGVDLDNSCNSLSIVVYSSPSETRSWTQPDSLHLFMFLDMKQRLLFVYT